MSVAARARGASRGALGACALAALIAWPAAGQPADGGADRSAAPRTSRAPLRAGAALRPSVAELGQRVLYRGWVLAGQPVRARWLAPDSSAAYTWGEPAVSRRGFLGRRTLEPGAWHALGRETLFVEVPLQAFALGRLAVPGLRVEVNDGRGPRVHRLPVVTLTIAPVLTAADSNADFRALHGPLAAPWWERVPWTALLAGLLALALVAALVVAWRRRRAAGAAEPAAAPAARDPLAEALAALVALRERHLPEHGRFAEHAFGLGQILRRYLEAVTGITRPGDTTPELVAHLRQAGLEPDDLSRLSGLLRAWDRVKFAREPFTLDEAVRAERATEAFLRRPAPLAATERVA